MDTVSPRIVTALDDAWTAIRARHPEVPEVVVALGSGTSGGPARRGHFAARRWVRGADEVAELFVSGEGLRLGPRDVLGTLLHEAAHGVADTRGIVDTSRQGRFHNGRYRRVAETLGLVVDRDGGNGWAATTVPEVTAAAYTGEVDAIAAALTAYRNPECDHGRRGRRSSSNNGLAAVCGCGRRIRVSAAVLDGGPILCGVCGDEFQPR